MQEKNMDKKIWTKKPEGEALGFFLDQKYTISKIRDLYHSKIYLGSNANLMVCARSAKCILVILSEVEAAAAFTVPFKAAN